MTIFFTVLVLTITAATTAFGQGSKPMALGQLAAYNKPDREKVLYEGAKAEGKITWYTSLAGGSYKDLAGAFEAKYPGVKVESYRGTRARAWVENYWRKASRSNIFSTRWKRRFRF